MRAVALRRFAVLVVGRLPGSGRFDKLPTPSDEGRPAAARRSCLSVVAGAFSNAILASGVCAAGEQPAFCADGPAFAFRPLLAGRASLTESGFVETRALGLASFAPDLRLPVELVYRSACEESGMFGHGWSCPQLESSVLVSEDLNAYNHELDHFYTWKEFYTFLKTANSYDGRPYKDCKAKALDLQTRYSRFKAMTQRHSRAFDQTGRNMGGQYSSHPLDTSKFKWE